MEDEACKKGLELRNVLAFRWSAFTEQWVISFYLVPRRGEALPMWSGVWEIYLV